jgi:serine/threonine protein kinase
MAGAMSYLHNNNIVHGDLRTQNIFIDGKTAKLTDFGKMKKFSEISSPILGMRRLAPPKFHLDSDLIRYSAPEVKEFFWRTILENSSFR